MDEVERTSVFCELFYPSTRSATLLHARARADIRKGAFTSNGAYGIPQTRAPA